MTLARIVAGIFGGVIGALVMTIVADLLPRQPRAAAEMLVRLLRLDRGVFDRADDSDGFIGDVFRQGVADCGRAWLLVPDRNPVVLARLVTPEAAR